jgi:hypothetical protein
MIIHQPEIIRQNGYAILYAKIEMAKKRENFPDNIWYRVPERFAPYLKIQSDAFLVASLLTGMYFEEDIQVRGTVSPRLAYHLEEYQFILNLRTPDVVRPVSIRYEHLSPVGGNPAGVGTTFSGGVDSLFTIWKHLPQNQPDPNYQITHGIFIRGFDILHNENDDYQQLFSQYSREASEIGIELIELETNVVSMTHQRMNLSYFYGPLILSTGLAMSGLFHRFYIPSSWDYHTLQHTAHASDPLVDGFLSTDAMEIVHHGSTHRRIEKVEQIANWEPAQKILWVCLEAKFKEHSWNCSRCEKCVRTMIPLYALGVLDKFKTFEKPIQKNWEILWYARKFNLRSNYVSEMYPYLRRKKPDLIPWLVLTTILGYLRYILINYLPKVVRHRLRRYGYFVSHNDAPDAYENHEVIQIIRSYHDHSST